MTYHSFDTPLEPAAVAALDEIASGLSWHQPLLGLAGTGNCAFLPDTHWLSGVVYHYGALANQDTWKYEILGSSAVQFCRLPQNAQHDWHIDHLGIVQLNNLVRKLTVVIDLQNPTDCAGGELQINGTEQGSRPRIISLRPQSQAGSIHVFPSILPFRTTTITSGQRKYLLGWIMGPAFT